jgi:mannitol-1-phosphate/altronate dehydrogenase
MTKLSNQSLNALKPAVKRPTYDRRAVTPGIVHFGIGAFHRAHQMAGWIGALQP